MKPIKSFLLVVTSLVLQISFVSGAYAEHGRSQGNKAQPRLLSKDDAAAIAEAYSLCKQLGDKLWPGWSDVSVPLLYITEDYEYAIRFPKTLQGAQQLDVTVIPGEKVWARRRTFKHSFEASFDVEGVYAVVIGSPEVTGKSPSEWVLIAVHEMFHIYQSARGGDPKVNALRLGPETDASWQINFPFPYQDADVMRLIQLQNYLLYLAITDPDNKSATFTAGNQLDAVKVYQRFLRQQDSAAKLYDYSKFQEWAEGIARYTEYKMAEMASQSGYQPTSDFRRLKGFKSYQQLWEETYKNKPFLIKHGGRIARSRTVFYSLGFGKAMLLDRLMPDWKSKYFEANIWLDDLLLMAVSKPQ